MSSNLYFLAVVHGIDLTDALGQGSIATADGLAMTAGILDELIARRYVPGRPADLADDMAWVRAASGRAPHARYPAPADRLRRHRLSGADGAAGTSGNGGEAGIVAHARAADGRRPRPLAAGRLPGR
jgi:hypothetical protein